MKLPQRNYKEQHLLTQHSVSRIRLLLGRGKDHAITVEEDIPQMTVNLRSSNVTHAKSKGT